jgi:hypothetical protein
LRGAKCVAVAAENIRNLDSRAHMRRLFGRTKSHESRSKGLEVAAIRFVATCA